MSYTPNTWNLGDIITPQKLNNIEQGITNKADIAILKLSASGYGSSSHLFGCVCYAIKENNNWILINDNDNNWISIGGGTQPPKALSPIIIPPGNDIGVFLVLRNADSVNLSGNISSTTETLYFSYGSIESGYRITGNCNIEFITE